MNEWKQQGTGLVGPLTLTDGTTGRIVLVGPRSAADGAMVVLPGKEGGPVKPLSFPEVLDRVSPATAVEVLCAQERRFGEAGLPALDVQ